MVSECIPSAGTCSTHINQTEHLKNLSVLEFSSCISAPLCDSDFSLATNKARAEYSCLKVTQIFTDTLIAMFGLS